MSFQDFWYPPLLCLPLIGANMLAVPFGRGATPLEQFWWWPRGIRVGHGKTLQGFLGGWLSAVLVTRYIVILIAGMSGNLRPLDVWDFNSGRSWMIMLAMGFGALFGDLVESAYKRRRGMAPGQHFWPWDQMDAVIGGFTAVALVDWPWFYLNIVLRWQVTVIWIIIYMLVHPLFSLLSYMGGLKSQPH